MLRGNDYDPARDRQRLLSGLDATMAVMIDGEWRTKPEIEERIASVYSLRVPAESIGRYLRYAREPRNGEWVVEKRRRGDGGTYEYRMHDGR